MARRRRSWDDKPPKTVFRLASAGVRNAITRMAQQVVTRFHVAPVPTGEMLKMVVQPDDLGVLHRARRLTNNQNRGQHTDFMLNFDRAKGEWADRARIRLRVEGNDPEAVLVPDYCSPSHWTTGNPGTNLMPGASLEHTMALEHGVRDLIEVGLDWALVQALFDYLDGKPETYKKANVRFLWSGIMPLLRHGGESCQTAALDLAKVKDSGWCETPKELYPAIQHANEVIARGQLLVDLGSSGNATAPVAAVGYAMPKVMCGEITHPQWPFGPLQPMIFA